MLKDSLNPAAVPLLHLGPHTSIESSKMRYQNWDVLIFPDECKIPLQEFKTTCQVIQDSESHSLQSNPSLLPTVTCFIPGLHAGAFFRVSIHSWQNPEISRYVQAMQKAAERVLFEARLFIDGRIAGSKWFHDDGPWPSIIELSIDLDKRGEFEKLKFPTFHKELLSQSYWNAGDDLGRIKLTIAEGFARDNLTYPFERIKNVVTFSFQHAPLDVLETSSIAWPNAAMWRQVSLLAPFYNQYVSLRHEIDDLEAHSHSPRQSPTKIRHPLVISKLGPMASPSIPAFSDPLTTDPFTEPIQPSAAATVDHRGWRQPSDTSMADYSIAHTRSSGSRHFTDPMVLCDKQARRFETMQSFGAYDSLCEALSRPAAMPLAPVNTPQDADDAPVVDTSTRVLSASALIESIPSKLESEEWPNSSINPAPLAMKNSQRGKENLRSSPHNEPSQFVSEGEPRKVFHPFATLGSIGNKRQRIVTPVAARVIDAEDEPRTSPSSRRISRGSGNQENEPERRVLNGIESI